MSELRICLDPGHGKLKNQGYIKGFYEGTNNYYLAMHLKEELEKYEDIKVFVTRKSLNDGDNYDGPSLPERGQFAIDNKCEVMISLHSNAFSSSAACGLSCFRSVLRPESEKFILKLAKAVVEVMNAKTGVTYLRGNQVCINRLDDNPKSVYYNQDWYGILRNSVKRDGSSCVRYAAIIEHGFHTNPKECAFLVDDDNLKKIAQTEAKVIAEYFNKKLKSVQEAVVTPTTSTPSSTTFKAGDLVKIIGKTYYSGKTIPAWVRGQNWYIKSAPAGSDRIVIDENENGTSSICSPINIKDLQLVKSSTEETKFKIGDKVKFKSTATTWASDKKLPNWIKQETLYIRSEYRNDGKWIVVSTLKTGAISGTAKVEDLERIN